MACLSYNRNNHDLVMQTTQVNGIDEHYIIQNFPLEEITRFFFFDPADIVERTKKY